MNARLIGVCAAIAGLMAAGLSTGTQIYYLLAVSLICMVALGFLSVVITLATVRIGLKGMKARVTRGDILNCVFTVRHMSPLPVASIRIMVDVPSATMPTQEIRVATPPFRERMFRHMIRCPHRGIYQAGITTVAARDLFGFFRMSKAIRSDRITMEVLPRETIGQSLTLAASDIGPEYRAQKNEDAASPSDIRAWQDGDSLKKVHWKLSMRKRQMMVRTYEESARPDTLLIPDLSAITAMTDEQLTLEDSVCESALAAAKAQLDAGYPVRMPLTSSEPAEIAGQHASDIQAFADALLRVKFDSPYAYEKVLIQMTGRMQRTGGAILVTAKLTLRVADAAIRMQQSGIRTRLLWVTDDERDEAMMLIARMRMANVDVRKVDPWYVEAPEPDEYDGDDVF